jgi:hypothetical protein
MTAFDAVDGSSTGIAMWHIAVVSDEPRMSGFGGGLNGSTQHIPDAWHRR